MKKYNLFIKLRCKINTFIETQTTYKQIDHFNYINKAKCLFCQNTLLNTNTNENFTLLHMPDHDLHELEDNFWCHKHDHSHEHENENENHEHDLSSKHAKNHENDNMIKKYLRKSILHNKTLILINDNHVNLEAILISDDLKSIKCSKCNYNLGYATKNNANKKYDYYLWKSNLILNSQIIDSSNQINILKQIDNGRYIIKVKFEAKKYLFVWIMNELYYAKVELTEVKTPIVLNKKYKKVLYKLNNFDTSQAENPNIYDRWKNDINVDLIEISNENYLKLIDTLVKSTQELPQGMRTTQNGFFIAVI
jgi:hypothetical protein